MPDPTLPKSPGRPPRRRLLRAGLLPAAAVAALFLAGPPAALAGILDDAPSAENGPSRFLPVGEAFKVRWTWSTDGVATGEFVVAPGYYLYRDRIRVKLRTPAEARLGQLELPEGEVKEDPYAGRQVVYHRSFSARQAISVPAGLPGGVEIEVVWQGCADAGLCYPPVRRTFSLGT